MADKIVNKQELLARVASARTAGHSIVHCHGCFDIVHPGHVRHLEFARSQGDLLVVSLTGDSQIAKGDQRPYIPEELRAENLAALQVVDLVYINPRATAEELLADLRPDVYVKGREYEEGHHPEFARERAVVEQHGGRVVFSSGDVVFSSSRLLERMAEDTGLADDRLAAVCGRHGIDRGRCTDLLAGFAGRGVLVVGDAILDRYVLCDATDLASESPMMSLTRLEERQYVGGAAIVARHIAGLGGRPYLLSAWGRDRSARDAEAELAREGVIGRLMPLRDRLPEKTRFLVETTKVLRVEDGASQPLDSRAEQTAADWVEQIADDVDAVIFCDFGYGTLTGGLLDRLGGIKALSRAVVTADVSGSRSRLLAFERVDLLCPTERELRASLHDFERGLSNVAWNAMDATQVRHMIVTLGKKGVVVFDRQSQDDSSPDWRARLRSEYFPSLAERVVDPLGCGDALLAAATLTLAAGGSLMQAAYLGSAAAALEAADLGNMPIRIERLQRWLSLRGELHVTPGDGREPRVLSSSQAVTLPPRRWVPDVEPTVSTSAPAQAVPARTAAQKDRHSQQVQPILRTGLFETRRSGQTRRLPPGGAVPPSSRKQDSIPLTSNDSSP